MIHQVFPTLINITDYNMSQRWTDTISAVTLTKYYSLVLATGESRKNISEIPANLFSEESMSVVPELRELRGMFVDCFYKLYLAYHTTPSRSILTVDDIDQMLTDNGHIQVLAAGERKGIHNHTTSEAFGVFYLDDVDNDTNGGEIVLHDPSFHHLVDFCSEISCRIPTKKHRLIVGPAHVWHEVTTYTGANERVAIVVNLGQRR